MNLISDAWAQGAGAGGNPLVSLLPLVVLFGVMWFLMIRPQQKRAKEHREMVAALSKGNEVVTAGGILGRITELDENFVSVEVASGVVMRVQRHQIASLMPKGTSKDALKESS